MHHSAAGDGLRLIMTKSWKNWMDLINYVLIRNRSGNVAIIAIIFTREGFFERFAYRFRLSRNFWRREGIEAVAYR